MKFDQLDLDIIRLLQIDGRMSFREIGEKLDKPESTIRKRYNVMNENNCLKIVATTNPEQLGFGTMAIIDLKVEPKLLNSVAEQIAAFKEVRFIAYMAGRFDLLVEVYTISNEHLMDFISHSLSQIDGIRECNLSIEMKLYKESFDWLHHIEIE